MKSINYLSIFLVVTTMMLSYNHVNAQRGKKVKRLIPDVKSNKKYFRAKGMGEDFDQEGSRDVAMQIAQERLAEAIQSKMKSVREMNTKNEKITNGILGNRKGNKQIRQKITRLIYQSSERTTSAMLYDVEVIKEATRYYKKMRMYKTEISIQMAKKQYYNKLENELSNAISKEEDLKMEFDRERFKKVFKEAIDEYEKETNEK